MNNTKKLVLAGLFIAISVVGGALIVIPIGLAKAAPVQHFMNVVTAITLGPWYAMGCAFVTSLIRNLIGTGSIMAFPGSMIGALCCGLVYMALRKRNNDPLALICTLIAEMLGTGVLGGLCAYPVAILFMDVDAAGLAVTAYIIPFLISTVVGSLIAGVLVFALKAGGALDRMQRSLTPAKRHA